MFARPVRPGSFHVTIRNVRGLFLLCPIRQKRLTQVIWYAVAHVARKYHLQIHEILVMSNHIHIYFTDPRGNRPAAMALLNTILARQINALKGDTGTVFETYWSGEKLDDEAGLDAAVYVLANPVKDHIVERSSEWIGVSTLKMEYGESRTIRRPAVGMWADLSEKQEAYDRKRPMSAGRSRYRGKPSTMPEEVTLTLVRPPIHLEMTDAELRAEVRERLRLREDKLIEQRRAEGTRVLGIEGLRRKAANEGRRRNARTRREMMAEVPRYAGAPDLVARRKAEDREFQRRYKLAMERLLTGERDVVWPEYTWKMRVCFGQRCEGGTAMHPELSHAPLPA